MTVSWYKYSVGDLRLLHRFYNNVLSTREGKLKKLVLGIIGIGTLSGLAVGVTKELFSKRVSTQTVDTSLFKGEAKVYFDVNSIDQDDAVKALNDFAETFKNVDIRNTYNEFVGNLFKHRVADEQIEFRLNYIKQCLVILMSLVSAKAKGYIYDDFDIGIDVTREVLSDALRDVENLEEYRIPENTRSCLHKLVTDITTAQVGA